jgi:DNA-binding transcriptional regulator YiaG
VLEAVEMSRPYGTGELLTTVIERARQKAADAEREQVAGEIRDLVAQSGLSRQDFALRLGTSRSRLPEYGRGRRGDRPGPVDGGDRLGPLLQKPSSCIPASTPPGTTAGSGSCRSANSR